MGYTLAFNLELIYISGMEVIALTLDLCMCLLFFQIGINPKSSCIRRKGLRLCKILLDLFLKSKLLHLFLRFFFLSLGNKVTNETKLALRFLGKVFESFPWSSFIFSTITVSLSEFQLAR